MDDIDSCEEIVTVPSNLTKRTTWVWAASPDLETYGPQSGVQVVIRTRDNEGAVVDLNATNVPNGALDEDSVDLAIRDLGYIRTGVWDHERIGSMTAWVDRYVDPDIWIAGVTG